MRLMTIKTINNKQWRVLNLVEEAYSSDSYLLTYLLRGGCRISGSWLVRRFQLYGTEVLRLCSGAEPGEVVGRLRK